MPQNSQNPESTKKDTLSQLSQERATESNAIQIPQITLPKGGGALKGIDEKFQVNPVNGTSSFSIPMPLSPNRNGFTPQLALSYNSGTGNGLFGIGWDMNLPSIQRRTDKKLPRYFDSNNLDDLEQEDSFMFSGAEELVPLLDWKDEKWEVHQFEDASKQFTIRAYRPRIEGGFSKIERIYNKTYGYYWRVSSQDNITTFFGFSESCRIADPTDTSKVFQWLPEFSFDDKGSWVWYDYKEENLAGVRNLLPEKNRFNSYQIFTNKHLKNIKYGNEDAYYYDKEKGNAAIPYEINFPKNENHFFDLVFDYGDYTIEMPSLEEDKKIQQNGKAVDNWKKEARKDAFSSCRSCFEIRTYRLCQRILMFHNFPELGNKPTLVRSLDFDYKLPDTVPAHYPLEVNYLTSITQKGYVKKQGGTYSTKVLPKMTFDYQWLTWNTEVKTVSTENLVHAPTGLSGNYQWVDLYNEGINGILTEQANGWFYKSNLGQVYPDQEDLGAIHFSQAQTVMPKPSFSGLSNGVLLLQDLESNGEKQLVVTTPGLQGYFDLSDEGAWQPFTAFLKNLNLDLHDPNVRMLDINGDGKPEIVLSEQGAFWWWANAGKIGYDAPELAAKPYDEERGAAIVFSDEDQRIFLADMSGDGMTDILRIRNGEVCYWANMGYGRFGAKVTMGNSPVFDNPEMFNPAYIQLTDISGTGATDIIYLGKNKFKAYINLSGNAWSTPNEIEPFFPTEHPNKITVTDLLGNGTACIVWSSEMPAYSAAPMRYIDLMGGKKPHIMRSHENGLGKKTEVEYKSSTYFYLKDKLAGTSWITKLAFPVQCVSKTIVTEGVTQARFVAEYSYHHGYYDHAEREFRGFGRVDQYDTEDYENWMKTIASNGQLGKEHHEPPVLTRTWFHTGAYVSQDRFLKQYEKEYWYNAANKPLQKDDILDDAFLDFSHDVKSLSADEVREAARACKGMALRQEVFALDKTDKEKIPYTVATHTCHIRPLQPREKNKYSVFIVLESEAINFSYDRKPEDARVTHSMNLEIDQYAHVKKAVSIAYGRKAGQDSILPDYNFDNNFKATHQSILADNQHKTHVVLTEKAFTEDVLTNEPAYYRLPLPYEVKTFECQGTAFNKQKGFFTKKDILEALNGLSELPYEEAHTTKGKRLIEHVQTLYRSNDLDTPLPLGKLEYLALQWESYQLAFTPEILRGLYGGKLAMNTYDDVLLAKSKYEKIDATNYWISSGKPIYIHEIRNAAAVKNAFYLAIGYEDPFETKIFVNYDPHLMYIKGMTDALGNETTVETFDYRTLSPTKLKDINDNLSEIVTDELGMVVATAVYGKDGLGDTLDGGDWVFTQDRIDAFFINPVGEAPKLLHNASSCLVYDLNRSSNQPTRVATIARETHFKTFENGIVKENPITNFQVGIEYSDGLGNVALKKVQAESGEAYHVEKDADGKCKITTVDTSPSIRWIGNGRTVLNNKGKPIKQYEPYFSDTPQYEDENCVRMLGVTAVLHYDAIGRNIKTVLPDDSFIKVEFNAWEQRSFDQNDTIEESDWHIKPANTAAYNKTKIHADTPAILYLDSLGRPFFSLAHNKWAAKKDGGAVDHFEQFYANYAELDIEGNVHKVIDARNNSVMAYQYDMLGHRLYQSGMDNGEKWLLNDCLGKPLFVWDSRNQLFHTRYDEMHRPVEILKADYTAATNPLTVGNWHKLEIMVYGSNGLNNTSDDKPTNRNGVLKTHFDSTGIFVLLNNDFRTNPLESTRQFCQDHTAMPNWSQNVPLETEIWQSASRYDALNRPIAQTTPHLGANPPQTTFHEFDKSGFLKKVSAILRGSNVPKDFVKNIRYNEKGQRTQIDYGNNSRTHYRYDAKTYRLTRLFTVNTNRDGLDNGTFYQDLNYTYDPVGNILNVQDDAQQTIYFRNQIIEPSCAYEYDALYRLIRAEGREHIGQLANDSANNWQDTAKMNNPNPNEGNAMRRYIQQYTYDAVGNFTEMRHSANGGSWTRHYNTDNSSNRLLKSWVGDNENLTRAFTYDAHGSMTTMPHLETMVWNCKDQLEKVVRVNATLPQDQQGDTYHFQYDSSGQRSRKVTANNGNKKHERLYIGGFEIYREYTGNTVSLERETLHILDNTQRIAMVETRTLGMDDTEGVLTRYQMSNHLSTVSLELDDLGAVISYEEYHPYGTTAYQARNAAIKSAAKRYRYTGMERDEETGLAYHSARYYVPWLGRWGSTDPLDLNDGINMYVYSGNRPTSSSDPTGLWEWPSARTIAIVAAVVVVAVAVTVLTAGAGTALLGAAVGAAGLTGTAATAATAVGTVVVAAASGAAGSIAATATTTGITEGRLPNRGEVRDAAVSGAVAGVVTLGIGAALSAGARGTVSAARAATVAGNASRATRAVAAVGRVADSTSRGGTAVRALARAGRGGLSGAAGGGSAEATRQVVSGERAARGGFDTDRIGSAAAVGGGLGAAGDVALGPALQNLSGRAFEGGYVRGIGIRSLPVRAQGLSWLSSQTGNSYLIGEHGVVSGRQVVTVATPSGPRAFYSRTGGGGTNSGGAQPGDWAPFDGFSEGAPPFIGKGWFVKDNYAQGGESDPLFRFGTQENLDTSRWLGNQDIPEGVPTPHEAVQGDLQQAGVPLRDHPIVDMRRGR